MNSLSLLKYSIDQFHNAMPFGQTIRLVVLTFDVCIQTTGEKSLWGSLVRSLFNFFWFPRYGFRHTWPMILWFFYILQLLRTEIWFLFIRNVVAGSNQSCWFCRRKLSLLMMQRDCCLVVAKMPPNLRVRILGSFSSIILICCWNLADLVVIHSQVSFLVLTLELSPCQLKWGDCTILRTSCRR